MITPNLEKRICQNCQNFFAIEVEDFAFYERMKVPAPTFCPGCRDQRRLCFRNGHSLYKRRCDLCGKTVVSRISPDKPYPMFCKKCWWSDRWDSLSYGRDYDFSRPFFEQFRELLLSTPHISILNANTVNSDWVNQETDAKNCYLNIGGHFNEDSAYNTFEIRGRNCFDNYWVWQCELCYENINCERCYKTLFSRDCFDCLNLVSCFDCRNCQNVFGCAGLRNKQYYIFNKPYAKEDYQEFISRNPLSSFPGLAALKEKAKKVWLSVPHRAIKVVKSLNASGCYIAESKNVSNAWWTEKCEDSKHLFIAASLKDCYDGTCFGWSELGYEVGHSMGINNGKFCAYIMTAGRADKIACFNLEYCFATPSCSNCFGCCNLKGQEYCILNKKYSKQDYEETAAKIKRQMEEMPYKDKRGRAYCYGEFFPAELSPFGYNETTAQDYYLLTEQEARDKGFEWSNYESEIQYEFSDYKIPDDISDVKDDVLEKILKCEVSGRAYKIIPSELEFYRKMRLPLPRRAPLQRHKDRLALLPPNKLFLRQCQKCQKQIQSVYSPERAEIIYCEKCYQAAVA